MDQIKKCKTLLQSVATRELNAVEHAMREELSRRMVASTIQLHVYRALISAHHSGNKEQTLTVEGLRDKNKALESTNQVLQDENKALRKCNIGLENDIDCLQQKVSRTSKLEIELEELRAIVASKTGAFSNDSPSPTKVPQRRTQLLIRNPEKPPEEQKHVNLKDIELYRQQFIECSKELDRVKKARAILESKCKTWKGKYHKLALQQDWQKPKTNYSEDPPSPGSAPVTQSNQGSDVLVSKASELASNAGRRPADPPDVGENPKVTPDAHIDQDDAETSDESDHLVAAEDRANANGLPNNNELNTSHPQMKKSQSEEPVFIREIPVNVPAKRKRDRSPANASRRPNPMKEETLSSSPIAHNARRSTAAVQESIDLDEISGDIYTPRKDQSKRQQVDCTRSLSPSIQRMLDARPPKKIGSEKPRNQTKECNVDLAFSEDEKDTVDDVAEVRDDAYYKRLGEEHAARIRDADKWNRAEKMRAKQRLHNEHQLSKHKDMKEAEMWHPSAAMQKKMNQTHVLQPTDVNVVLPRTNDIPSNKKRRSNPRNDHRARYIQQLAEDGESSLDTENALLDGPQDQVISSKRSGEGFASFVNLDAEARQRRLDQLLTRPSPEKPLLNARDTKAQVANIPSTFDPCPFFPDRVADAAAPKTPNLEREDRSNARNPRNSVSIAARALKPVNTPNYSSPFARPSSKKPTKSLEPPLRSRPLSQLALNDFKINPNHNQGYDYAFKEVIRKQDQRKCLPGCTRLDCCGAIFRKMAETMDNHFFHTSRLMGPSQEFDEQAMMEDYLGDQAYRLKGMSPERKAETLLQAKTKGMADHYGRHREVYAREPSPVGYWDVDMPNSQEAAENGRLAEIRTRQKVEERYNEAVKQDGLWKFRDE
ncbi:MAG: hypothetical protein L6R38_007013 [Xanthoria sp. 2 TBL-2021]|nr:MAG: hypothetical protein L6R38_007013 [Xanthoria sp. 2 TBL-2021]